MAVHSVEKLDPRGRFLAAISDTATSDLFVDGPTSVAVDAAGDLFSSDGDSIVKYSQDGKVIARWR